MKLLKKAFVATMCFTMCISFASCGAKKDEKRAEKDIASDAKKMDEDITSGQFVLDGKVYSFPMKLSELLNDGWHISNNYDNVDDFELEAGEMSQEFEVFMDDSSSYLSVSVINDTGDTSTVHDCLISSLSIMTSRFDVTLPGGLTETAKPDDIEKAYGTATDTDEADDGTCKYLYTFTSEDWECSVMLVAINAERVSAPLSRIEYEIDIDETTGFESTEEECRKFFDTAMKTSFYGDYEEYVQYKYDTESNAVELYESEIDYYAQAIMYYCDIDSDYIDDDSYDEFLDISAKVLKNVEWSVDEIDVEEDSFEGTITVTLYPTDYLRLIDDKIDEAIAEFNTKYANVDFDSMSDSDYEEAEKDYVVNMLLPKIKPFADSVSLMDGVTKTYELDEDTIISDDDWEEIDDLIMDILEEED